MKKIASKKTLLKQACMLIMGCLCCSVATNWILIPNGLTAPGITGISMTVEHFTGINYSLVYYAITILILILTWFTLGKKDASNIVILSLLYPAVLSVLSYIDVQIVFEDKLIALAVFGVIYGAGIGLPYRIGFSYGGDDTLAKVLKNMLAGNYYSSAGPEIYDWGIRDGIAYVDCSDVFRIDFIAGNDVNDGTSHVCKDYEETIRYGEYVLKGHETYVRVKCTDKNGKTAWSNPIFMQGRKRG